MKSYIKLIIILLLASSYTMRAQTVSGTFFKLPQQKIYLSAYTGLNFKILDSVMMNQDGSVSFNAPLKTGMYVIDSELGGGLTFLYDGKPVSFVMKNPEDWKSVQFIHSDINTQWLQYQILKEETFNLQEPLKQVLRDYDKNSDFYQQARQEYNRIQNKLHDFTEELLKNNDNYAAKLIRVDRPLTINIDDDFQKQREDLIAHFFDDTDFADTTLIPTNVLTTKIIDYLSVVQHSKQSSQGQMYATIMGIDNVLKLASVSFTMYKFVFQYLIEGFNQFKFYDYVDYMSRLPYVENMNITDLQYETLNTIVENNSKVRIGEKAPEIKGETLYDKYLNLYEIQSDYTIVFFWSYSCDHCREIIKDLSNFLKENPEYTLVSISVKGKPKEIKKLIRKNKLNGYFYWDGLEWKGQPVVDYCVNSTPSIFILDKDKNVLLKPFGMEELIDFNNQK